MYIERKAAFAKIKSLKGPTRSPAQNQLIQRAMIDIAGIPAADVDVKRGEWNLIKRKNMWGDIVTVCECSSCGKSDTNGKGIMWEYDYCPNCGAKMKG